MSRAVDATELLLTHSSDTTVLQATHRDSGAMSVSSFAAISWGIVDVNRIQASNYCDQSQSLVSSSQQTVKQSPASSGKNE
jgi:hypothetical protein